MIGILLALQVNHWNEEKQNRKLEKEYLQKLVLEFDANKQSAEINLNYQQFLVDNAMLILTTISGDTVLQDAEALAVAIEHVGWTFYIDFIKDVWNELHSTGNIRIIQNTELRNALTDFYRTMEVYFNEERECSSFNLGVRRLLGDVLDSQTRLQFKDILAPCCYEGGLDPIPDLNEINHNLNQLSGLNGYLLDIVLGRRATASILTSTIEQIDHIQDLLSGELNKLQ